MNSIPQAIPERMWHRDDAAPAPTRPAADFHGCKFADRCPHVMATCQAKHPPLYRTADHRAVACYLHEKDPQGTGMPTLDQRGLEQVFITAPTAYAVSD
jgi:oligopeptide/dipeptide ABC transporter ATP-binding protein